MDLHLQFPIKKARAALYEIWKMCIQFVSLGKLKRIQGKVLSKAEDKLEKA